VRVNPTLTSWAYTNATTADGQIAEILTVIGRPPRHSGSGVLHVAFALPSGPSLMSVARMSAVPESYFTAMSASYRRGLWMSRYRAPVSSMAAMCPLYCCGNGLVTSPSVSVSCGGSQPFWTARSRHRCASVSAKPTGELFASST
jgi:hypothetical protein